MVVVIFGQVITKKLDGKTIRFSEVEEIFDILGYKISIEEIK